MKQSMTDDRSRRARPRGMFRVVGNLFGNTSRTATKSELVILIKPTVIQGDASWEQDISNARERIDAYERRDERGAAAPAAR